MGLFGGKLSGPGGVILVRVRGTIGVTLTWPNAYEGRFRCPGDRKGDVTTGGVYRLDVEGGSYAGRAIAIRILSQHTDDGGDAICCDFRSEARPIA